jgi:hypothetical protein
MREPQDGALRNDGICYPSGQSMLVRRKRSGLVRTPTIPTFCIITIITRCDDFQYLDGPLLTLNQIHDHLP